MQLHCCWYRHLSKSGWVIGNLIVSQSLFLNMNHVLEPSPPSHVISNRSIASVSSCESDRVYVLSCGYIYAPGPFLTLLIVTSLHSAYDSQRYSFCLLTFPSSPSYLLSVILHLICLWSVHCAFSFIFVFGQPTICRIIYRRTRSIFIRLFNPSAILDIFDFHFSS